MVVHSFVTENIHMDGQVIAFKRDWWLNEEAERSPPQPRKRQFFKIIERLSIVWESLDEVTARLHLCRSFTFVRRTNYSKCQIQSSSKCFSFFFKLGWIFFSVESLSREAPTLLNQLDVDDDTKQVHSEMTYLMELESIVEHERFVSLISVFSSFILESLHHFYLLSWPRHL